MTTANKSRDISGVLILDKPQGPTSNAVLQSIKSLFNAKKAGHTGTLDPLATGVLPICFGESTKFSQYLIYADKQYQVKALLGIRTNTADSLGDIIQRRPVTSSYNDLEPILDEFRGEIIQTPSIFSAIKYRGIPLYKYARQGISIPRQARTVTVQKLDCTRYHNGELSLTVHCSKGTYIRSLIDDIGERLGCGAHVTMLRRTQVANYSIEYAVALGKLYSAASSDNKSMTTSSSITKLDSFLLPTDALLSHLPEVKLDAASVLRFSHGISIQVTEVLLEGYVRVIEGENRDFIGLGEITKDGYLLPRRLLRNVANQFILSQN